MCIVLRSITGVTKKDSLPAGSRLFANRGAVLKRAMVWCGAEVRFRERATGCDAMRCHAVAVMNHESRP